MGTSKGKYSSERTKQSDIATVVGIVLFFAALITIIGVVCWIAGEFFEALIRL